MVEIRIANTSVTENSRNARPTMPPMNSSGMNAATSEMLIDTTVKPICRAPSMVARSGECPFSMLRNTFSIITIASSTTKPTETASAISDRLSIENPTHHISAQVPASDSGTVTPAARVGVARRRNRNTTSITSAMVPASVSCMSATLARIVPVRSDRIETSMSAGIQRLISGISARMLSTVSMTLASPCLVMMISTDGSRLNQAAERLLRVLCSTDAMSESRTTLPLADLTTSVL